MAQVKECLEKMYECAKIRNAVPKSCVLKTATYNHCKCKSTACETFKDFNYKYVQPSKPNPIKPTEQNYASNAPFAEDSVYSCEFTQYDPDVASKCRPEAVVHENHLTPAGEFQDDTEHKTSYPVKCVPSTTEKIIPKDHYLKGQGPMRMLTMQKHDYYGMCPDREKSIMPHGNLKLPDCPMATSTTTRCTYQPVLPPPSPMKNYRPDQCYKVPANDMDLNTVQRSSYKPVEAQEKPETPWAVKLNYCKPKDAIECCTEYNNSYTEPGAYVLQDKCGNVIDVIEHGKLKEDCCPFQCLAKNVEEKAKSQFIKAHHFEDN